MSSQVPLELVISPIPLLLTSIVVFGYNISFGGRALPKHMFAISLSVSLLMAIWALMLEITFLGLVSAEMCRTFSSIATFVIQQAFLFVNCILLKKLYDLWSLSKPFPNSKSKIFTMRNYIGFLLVTRFVFQVLLAFDMGINGDESAGGSLFCVWSVSTFWLHSQIMFDASNDIFVTLASCWILRQHIAKAAKKDLRNELGSRFQPEAKVMLKYQDVIKNPLGAVIVGLIVRTAILFLVDILMIVAFWVPSVFSYHAFTICFGHCLLAQILVVVVQPNKIGKAAQKLKLPDSFKADHKTNSYLESKVPEVSNNDCEASGLIDDFQDPVPPSGSKF